ncbi:hypothetical protein E4T44_05924 [Aureobasidium sp. EXF-8845]|nr:hypothetical protein E4T44_05924 [Aureobasidium sp. EXF-8845]KAI4849530.1 hypothetical protein E4T45_05874 [Aureobasidium sp. EXF-8846]
MESHHCSTNSTSGGCYPNEQPMLQPAGSMVDGPTPESYQIHAISRQNLGSCFSLEDPRSAASQHQVLLGGSKRSVRSADYVKHRRTRSGCFTCRQRRVKCDEAHPVCERCRKAKRACHYPISKRGSPTSFAGGLESKDANCGIAASFLDDHGVNELDKLHFILDGDKLKGGASSSRSREDHKTSGLTSNSRNHSPMIKNPVMMDDSTTPTCPPAAQLQVSDHTSRELLKSKRLCHSSWAHLPLDMKFYITYHQDKLSHQYYAMKNDSGGFLKTTFLEIALGYDPLLYAITAFSAYQYSLTRPDGELQSFLGFYDKSISLLRHSLKKSSVYTVATLLTILQLATVEEMLGDWVSLMGHQRAAYEILTELYTPQTVMECETHRKIISWFVRFDLFASFMRGRGPVSSRDWHAAYNEYYVRQARERPQDLGSLFEEKFAQSRLAAMDMSLLFARYKDDGSSVDFITDMARLSARLDDMSEALDGAFADTRTYVKDFPNAPQGAWDNVVGSLDPNFLCAGDLFTWNFVLIDFWAIHLLFKSQVAQIESTVRDEEIVALATKVCKMFESLQYCDQDSTAMILRAHVSMGIAAACLPKDHRHTMWCRKKYAQVEQCGYIYPVALRKRMTRIWGVDVMRWWLPNDAGYFPVLQAIRDLTDYRAPIPQDTTETDLRDMKGLFSTLRLGDSGIKTDGVSDRVDVRGQKDDAQWDNRV